MVLALKAPLSLLEETETEILSRGVEKALGDIHDQILLMDNGAGFIITEKEARDFLEGAGDFVQKSKSGLEEWLQTREEK